MTIEHLPSEAIGIILSKLNLMTGSEGIRNEADIPVVMRFAMNLACTSKTMYRHVHSLGASRIFLASLTAKYGKSPEHFAAELDTEGARRFLWDTMQKNGDKKNYEIIQAIYALVINVKKEAQEAGVDVTLSEGGYSSPSPNPYYSQTQRGFFLFNDGDPSHLATPFGKIDLLGGGGYFGGYGGYSRFSVSEVLIRRLGATFKGLTSSDVSLCRRYSVYQINESNGEALPQAAWPVKPEDTRSYGTINKIWELLEIEKSGGDPCLKPPSSKRARPTCMTETAFFSTCAEIIPWVLSVVSQLKQQPVFCGAGSFSTQPIRVMSLENASLAFVVELLHEASTKKERSITTFGCYGAPQLYNEEGNNLGVGVQLTVDPSEIDLAALPTAYRSVLSQLGSNWKFAQLKDYPDILRTRSEEDFMLLCKTRPFFLKEALLIRELASLTGISRFITCSDPLKGVSPFATQIPPHLLHLWIKKDKFHQVAAVLNLSPTRE